MKRSAMLSILGSNFEMRELFKWEENQICHFVRNERKELICLFPIQAIQEIQTLYNCFD